MSNAYDSLGRPISSTTDMDGTARTLAYGYDAGGRRDRLTYPDPGSGTAPFFTFEHDGRGRPTRILENGASWQALFTYRPSGALHFRHLWSAAMIHDQDAIGRLTALSHLFGPQPAARNDYGFGYNSASQIVERTTSQDAYAWTGHYAADRDYTADGLNRYSQAGLATFGYDANGNLTGNGATTYAYDVENRLVSASGASSATLHYDPLGRLWQVAAPSGTTRFLYDGDALVEERDGSGNVLNRYLHGFGVDDPLIWYEGAEIGANRRRLLTDHQGSITAVTDSAGNPIAINAYDEYGIPGAGNQGRFQYTGQAFLAELGLYHYKARVYSPTLGRFLQTDPVGYEDQFNLYAYVGNDPVNHTDPTGQYECKTEKDCSAAATGIAQIRAAQNFFRSPALGSRIARSESAARALGKVLSSLGTRGDGGVNIRAGDLPGGVRSEYAPRTNTITLDTDRIRQTGGRIGESLGHEAQKYRQRHEILTPLAREVRPLAIQYIIGRAPGGSINGSGRDYISQRLHRDYCHLPARFCNPAVNQVMDDELSKPN